MKPSCQPVIPPHLCDQIEAGRCTAFVGAGFSAPAVPAWKALLSGLSERVHLEEDTRTWLAQLIEHGGSRDLEAAAQVLQGAMGDRFDPALAEVLQSHGREDTIAERRRLLKDIPFQAILTTNFDPFLVGEVPGPDAYLRVLRDPPHRWWQPRFWGGAEREGAPVIKLHGEAGPIGSSVVFTQRDYRQRLYSSPAYMTFLRSIFATNTMFFLGVSFTDSYLNELRSEVLAMFDHHQHDHPVDYAVLPDVQPQQERYLRSHEGLGVISYDTKGGTDFSGFDKTLQLIHDATSPRALLGRSISGRTILWADPDPEDTSFGSRLLVDAAEGSGGTTTIEQVRTVEDAVGFLLHKETDLVIVDSAGRDGSPMAEELLTTMRSTDLRAPVIVFARGRKGFDRRRALSLGATAVLIEWGDLLREVSRLLE